MAARVLPLVVILAALSACGSGGGGDHDRGPAPRVEPIAGGIGDGRAAVDAPLAPYDVAVDPAGNVVVVDSYLRVRRIDARTGRISTIAKRRNGEGCDIVSSSADCFFDILSVAVDARGNVIVVDDESDRIVRLDGAGGVEDVGRREYCVLDGIQPVDGVLATNACFYAPHALAAGPDGDLYFAEANARILRVDGTSGRVSVVAGDGTDSTFVSDHCPDDRPATETCLGYVQDVAVGPDGAVFVAVFDRVRRVDPVTGIITSVAGRGSVEVCRSGARGDGGRGRQACVEPREIAVAPDGTLAIADGPRLRFVDPETGVITTVPYAVEPLYGLGPLAFDARGDVVAVRHDTSQVVRIERDGDAAGVIAGSGSSICGDRGPADEACIGQAWDVAVDHGDVLVADGPRVRRITARDGRITTIAGGGRGPRYKDGPCRDGLPAMETCFDRAARLAMDATGSVLVLDATYSYERGDRVRRIDRATRVVTTLAGTTLPYDGDRKPGRPPFKPFPGLPATEAFLQLEAMAVSPDGALVLATSRPSQLWRVEPSSGLLTLVAGRGRDCPQKCPACGDGGPAVEACLDLTDVKAAPNGDLYLVSDVSPDGYSGHTRVRRVDAATGLIETVAGNGRPGHCGDGGPATDACISAGRVVLEPDGDLLIAGGGVVRRVDAATGIIATVAPAALGPGKSCRDGTAPWGPCVSALALDPLGRALYVDDGFSDGFSYVRRLTLAE